jgi:aspartyl-tRNA(Asn)/glutamyl-tRNA(Gln) amidotransferase subunit A
VVGLKPAYGEIPVEGVVPLSQTLDHVGPIALTVSDAAIVYQTLLGRQPEQPASPVSVPNLRLAVPRRYFCDLLDDEVRQRFEETLDRLRAAGAAIGEVEIPHASDIASIYVRIGLREAARYHASTLETIPWRYTAAVRERLEMGRKISKEDYTRALSERDVLRREVDLALAGCDGLVLPTLPIPAPPLGADSLTIGGAEQPVRGLMLRLTQLFNLTGHPAIALPSGTTAAGLPCSLQLIGPATGPLLQVALACERHVSIPSLTLEP